MNDYISKPVKTNALKETIMRWFFSEDEAPGPETKMEALAGDMKEEVPVDIDCLKESAANDPEMLKEIVELYLQQTEEHLDELREAVKRGESKEVYRIAHKLIGSSATCGMTAIMPSLVELERMGREENLDGAEIRLKEAQDALNRISIYLSEPLNNKQFAAEI